MQVGGVAGGIYKVCDWLMKLAIVNLLWIAFTVLGLGIFGMFPATVALLTVLTRWIKKEECKVVQSFFRAYKNSFVKANMLMVLTLALGSVLAMNVIVVQSMSGILHVFLKYGLLCLFVMYTIIALYVIPMVTYRSHGVWMTMKMAFITGTLHPVRTGMLVGGFVLLYFVLRSIPGMIPFYGVSLMGMWTVVVLAPILSGEQNESNKEKIIKNGTVARA
ncbi:YesL family protein [Halalkalibacter alkaliphilus]|uniref:DUF624 domain-containing protein n=1 Tax=Halalkalibacter alkaliphilus TaxID=2917993 RepID=A0A9X2CTM9_9BACI|nr:DUF624 domain-containing protein [Halalkalibacter alkaliphilus]MCL7747979.1 DUF624 domain-containing protein [Halalkalibacter alkaliphilus]